MEDKRQARPFALLAPAIVLALTASGCRAVGDIFKAGVWVGVVAIVVVVALIAGIAGLARRAR